MVASSETLRTPSRKTPAELVFGFARSAVGAGARDGVDRARSVMIQIVERRAVSQKMVARIYESSRETARAAGLLLHQFVRDSVAREDVQLSEPIATERLHVTEIAD